MELILLGIDSALVTTFYYFYKKHMRALTNVEVIIFSVYIWWFWMLEKWEIEKKAFNSLN